MPGRLWAGTTASAWRTRRSDPGSWAVFPPLAASGLV